MKKLLLPILLSLALPAWSAQFVIRQAQGGNVPVTPSGGITAVSDAGVITLGSISLSSGVTGTLPAANGGTGITALGAGVADWLGTPSSANLLAAVTGETGTGSLVFNTNPTFAGTLSGMTGIDSSGQALTIATGGDGVTITGSSLTVGSTTVSFTNTVVLGNGTGATAAIATNLTGATDPTLTFSNNLMTASGGIAAGTLALGGATIGSHALAVTGTSTFSTNMTLAGGFLTLPIGTATDPSLNFSTFGLYENSALGIALAYNNSPSVFLNYDGLSVLSAGVIGFTSGTAAAARDTSMTRLAAGVLGVPGLGSTPQAVATTDGAAAAVNLTTLTSTYVTGASSNTTTTLAAGTNGQIKIISLITDGGQSLVVTVTNAFWGGAGTLTFDDAGDNVMLIYLNSKWQILVNNGVTAA